MSSNRFVLAATATAGLLASTASAAFNAAASTNVAMYWGQGNAQIPLSDVCNDDSIDIVNLAFVNQFPKSVGDYPATNFANACGDTYFTKPDGTQSGLLSSCPSIGPGIKQCQANGKKVLLSIGGGYPINYTLPSPAIAEYFAEFLWGAFGPSTAEWVNAGKPRPFGDASVDGFDLDIEALIDPAPSPDYLYANYYAFVDHLKNDLFPTGPGSYYISAAPQCQVPDVRLADAISKSHFDFIFAQFYNTVECNTRAGYNGLKTATTTFTFTTWVNWLKANSFNQNVKLYLGMPAGVNGAPSDPTATLNITEANALLSFYQKKHADIFGGAMLWEATVSAQNTKCQTNYSSWIKSILAGTFTTEVCPGSSSTIASSTSTQSSSSTIASSTSSSAAPTSTGNPTPDGTCGGTTGYTCIGFSMGECCSSYGYCGSSTAHCGVGCQPGSGKCGIQSSSSVVSSTIAASSTVAASSTTIRPSSTSSSAVATPTGKATPDGTCGGTTGYTCIGFSMGECCSQYGYCGSSTDHCGVGCQLGSGKCGIQSSSSSVVVSSTRAASSSVVVSSTRVSTTLSTRVASSSIRTSSSSTRAASSSIRTSSSSTRAASSTIRPSSSTRAASSSIRTSSSTRAASSTVKPSSTRATTTASRTSSTASTPTKKVTTDATCGGTAGFTCQGSTFGNCCSQSGWCGSSTAYCGTGCQKGFGTCT